MRHIRRFVLIPATLTLFSGCNLSDTGESAFNPAQDVEAGFSTFVLKDEENKAPNLPYTRFYDFYRGVQPNTADSEQNYQEALDLANALRDRIDVVAGSTRDEAASEYKSVRNPLDLMAQVIRSDEIRNFREGRQYIVDRIEENTAGAFNSRSAGATIRFTSQEAILEGRALADREWVYPTLDWRYQPEGPEEREGRDQKVYRTIQYVARSAPEGETATPPELVGVISGSRYDARVFSTTGYNAPEFTEADFNTRTYGSLEFRQDYVADHYDEIYIRAIVDEDTGESNLDEANRITVQGNPSDCVIARLDYDMQELYVWASNNEPLYKPGGEERNDAHCSKMEENNVQPVTYSVTGVPERA